LFLQCGSVHLHFTQLWVKKNVNKIIWKRISKCWMKNYRFKHVLHVVTSWFVKLHIRTWFTSSVLYLTLQIFQIDFGCFTKTYKLEEVLQVVVLKSAYFSMLHKLNEINRSGPFIACKISSKQNFWTWLDS